VSCRLDDDRSGKVADQGGDDRVVNELSGQEYAALLSVRGTTGVSPFGHNYIAVSTQTEGIRISA